MATRTAETDGSRLRAARNARDWSLREVEYMIQQEVGSDSMGALQAKLSRLETDKQKRVLRQDVDLWVLLAKLFKCSLTSLSPTAARMHRESVRAGVHATMSNSKRRPQNLKRMSRTGPANRMHDRFPDRAAA